MLQTLQKSPLSLPLPFPKKETLGLPSVEACTGPPCPSPHSQSRKRKQGSSRHILFKLLAVLHTGLNLAAQPGIVNHQLLVCDASLACMLSERGVQLYHLALTAAQQLPLQVSCATLHRYKIEYCVQHKHEAVSSSCALLICNSFRGTTVINTIGCV